MVASANLQLYIDDDFVSPYAFSAFVALTEKGRPFDLKLVNLQAKENLAADFSALSLTQRIPTLVHDGWGLSESSAIAEYLDEMFPERRLYPRDTRAQARARQVQAWLRTDLLPLRQERSTANVFGDPTDAPLSEKAQASVKRLLSLTEELLPQGEKNLFGNWTIADADLSLMLNRLVRNGDPVAQRIADYAQSQWQRPSVQQWVEKYRQSRR